MSIQPKKPTALSGNLVAIKGHATSAAVDVAIPVPAPVAPAPVPAAALGYLKSMTVKLDLERFTQLKRLGLDEGKSSQALIVEAIDMLLASKGRTTSM